MDMSNFSLSWFTANMPSPQNYFSTIIWYIPDTLDEITYWLNTPIVQKFAWIVLIAWFIFRLLRND